MELIQKYINYLRKSYFSNFKSISIKSSIALVLFIITGVLIDVFIPFNIWGNTIRAFLVAFGGFAAFTFCYLIGFFLYQSRRNKIDNYVKIKDRFSPSMRRRIAIVIFAVLMASIISTGKTPLYSTVNYFIIASIVALIVFVSMSDEEEDREYYGIPDSRDKVYYDTLERLQTERELKKQSRKNKKEKNKNTNNNEETQAEIEEVLEENK